MSPDDFQQAWQAQSTRTRVTIDADLLLQQVQRSQRDFRATIVRRDIIEIGVGLLLLPYWFYQGIVSSLPWTWYLTVPAILWVIGFLIVDRRRHPQAPSDPDEPLLECVKTSLRQVEHQMWLLRNVFWWYLLPYSIAILAFFAHSMLRVTEGWQAAAGFALLCGFLLVLYGFVYWLNQRAVRVELEPRRQELLGLLAGLADESTGELPTDRRLTGSAKRCESSPWTVVLYVGIVAGLCVALLAASRYGGDLVGELQDLVTRSDRDDAPRSSGPAGAALARTIVAQRQEKGLVGLGAMVWVDGKLEAAAAQGERKADSGVPLELGDQWHLGGISKSVTATMIARLIEAGKMKWTDTVGEILVDDKVHEDWKAVTLRQLLTDTAGAPANFPKSLWYERPAEGPERTQARREAVLNVLAVKPANPPGTKREYSNVGYTIVAAMAEKVTGDTWEDLVRREVIQPLKLAGSGFGPPTSSDEKLEQPRGHWHIGDSKYAVDDQTDNSPIMGPAGSVRMTLEDLCTFATEHLRGETGTGKLLSAETYKALHALELDEYACGWLRKEASDEFPYAAYWHNGSNKAWYALVVFIPERDTVIAVTSNDGDSRSAEAAAWEIVKVSAGYPKASPFAAVRWKKAQPEVEIEGAWYKLVSIDGIEAKKIVAFSQRTFDAKWRKRFEEDLVEVLTRMGHPPAETVKLVVQPVMSAEAETRVLERVPMTAANRQAIWDAGRDREE